MPSPSCYHPPVATWTLTSLIGAYLDLTLAYLFLIGSTLIFFTSKLLSFFNLSLPCPCNSGLFGHCLNDILHDSSRTRIESLNSSIRTRFPFDVIFDQPPLRLTGVETGGDGDRVGSGVGRRIRRMMISDRKGKTLAVSVVDSPSPMRLSWQEEGIGDNFGCESKEENFGDGQRIAEGSVSMVAEAAHSTTEYYSVEDTASATRDVHASNQSMDLIIRNLEQELEDAQAAHASLYLELEKERSAASTAADEAMAMILRLQSEKASVQMEARQYQRMIEEKSAYDDEEMEILKEIIMRRERENNVLQKEVEAYRQMMLSGEITCTKPEFLFDSSDDPTLMLKTVCESIGKKERVNVKMKHTDDIAGIHYPELPESGEECNMEFQEKGIVTVEVYPFGEWQNSSFSRDAIGYKLDGPQDPGFCKDPSCLSCEKDAGRESKIEMRISIDDLDGEDPNGVRRRRDSSQFEAESSVLDVHVIEDEHKLDVEENERQSNILKMASAQELFGTAGVADESPGSSNVYVSNKSLLTNRVGEEQDIQRSFSDIAIGNQMMDKSNNASHNDHRRCSVSSVDNERFELETEVEILRKRLKTIQQGRENLNFAVDYREQEAFQLQLLEEIACQLQVMRKITEPGRSTRQTSLPPLSSKVNTKKRHCSSVSWGLNESA